MLTTPLAQDPPKPPNSYTTHGKSTNAQIHKASNPGLGIRVLAVTTTGLSHGAWISRNRSDPEWENKNTKSESPQ